MQIKFETYEDFKNLFYELKINTRVGTFSHSCVKGISQADRRQSLLENGLALLVGAHYVYVGAFPVLVLDISFSRGQVDLVESYKKLSCGKSGCRRPLVLLGEEVRFFAHSEEFLLSEIQSVKVPVSLVLLDYHLGKDGLVDVSLEEIERWFDENLSPKTVADENVRIDYIKRLQERLSGCRRWKYNIRLRNKKYGPNLNLIPIFRRRELYDCLLRRLQD